MHKKIYIAGMFGRQKEFQVHRDKLINLGYTVTSTWLEENFADPLKDVESSRQAALLDLKDISKSNVFLVFTEHSNIGYYTGGRHVEFGYALALGLIIILCGPRENVFFHHERVNQVNDIDSAIQLLNMLD